MHPRTRTHLTAAAAAVLLALGAAPAAGAASNTLWQVDGSKIRTITVPGSSLTDGAPKAPSAGGLVASASRARAVKPKAKPKAKAYDRKLISRSITRLGGPPNRKTDASKALSAIDKAWRKAPKKSQAKRELEAVLRITTTMARSKRITVGRLPMLTATLSRNAEWWALRKSTSSGQRVQFEGSQLVWQYYVSSGIQVQWLGTFGSGNGLYFSGKASLPKLQTLVDEAIRLAVPRAGGIAWEYFFPFGGGSPPWASGMAQATGIQVLSRASGSLGKPALLSEAKSALGLMKTPPPSGVQVVDSTGTHFLIYSYSSMKVLNAMNQSVNGLYAYVLANPTDVDGRLLLLDGLRWLDANVSRYDTGSWSLYALGGGKANTHYHSLARDFLKTLCALLKTDERTPGGGPSGAFPYTRICTASDNFTKYLTKK